jgi:hypothetical protein
MVVHVDVEGHRHCGNGRAPMSQRACEPASAETAIRPRTNYGSLRVAGHVEARGRIGHHIHTGFGGFGGIEGARVLKDKHQVREDDMLSMNSRLRVGILVGVATAALAGSSATAWAASENPGTTNPLVATTPTSGPTNMAAVQAEVKQQLATTNGGTQVAPNVVSYNNDSVRVVFPLPGSGNQAHDPFGAGPAQASPQTSVSPNAIGNVHGCPYGLFTKWSCFYGNAGFGGNMLEFKDCGYEQYLSNYGFNHNVSAWVNTKDYAYVNVFDNGGIKMWTESQNTENGWVGVAYNDEADGFFIHSGINCQN